MRIINMLIKILIPFLDYTEKKKNPLKKDSWEDEDDDDDEEDDDDDDGNLDDDEDYKNFYRKNVPIG